LPAVGETADPPVLQISADGQHVAHVASTITQFCVVHDGRYGKPFRNGVAGITLSPDGKRLAYIGVEGNTQMLVLDGKVVTESTSSDGGNDVANAMAFSPDNQRFAYSHQRGGRWRLWVDGQEGEAFDAFGKASIQFSPNSRRIAFAAVNQGKWLVVTDGQKSAAVFDLVGTRYSPVFSPDSEHVAYSAKLDGDWFLVVDNEKKPTRYSSIKSMAFSSDSRHLAYHARRPDGWHLIVDSKPVGKAYYAVSSLMFDTAANLHFTGERHLETDKHAFVLVEAELAGREGDRAASH
jgi:WD40 repeat protein